MVSLFVLRMTVGIKQLKYDCVKYFHMTEIYQTFILHRFRHLRLKQRQLRDYVSEMVDLPKVSDSCHWNILHISLEKANAK